MSVLVQENRRQRINITSVPARFWWFAAISMVLFSLSVSDEALPAIILSTLSEAYLQVSVFVALTLGILFSLERLFKFDTVGIMERSRNFQVPLSALLGAIPGCGGAIVVVTQYASGRLSFGALLAALTATMGDAAFLLLAKEPTTALVVFALGAGMGMLTGIAVNALHGEDFLRPQRAIAPNPGAGRNESRLSGLDIAWLVLMGPGIVLGLLTAAQINLGLVFAGADVSTVVGVAGALLATGMWFFGSSAKNGDEWHGHSDAGIARSWSRPVQSVVRDTNFVSVWVIAAFLLYEVTVHVTEIDLSVLFAGAAPIVPLIAILVGFLPGCGPQIVVTSLYLSGAIPLAALLGNAISNDGDALFPAIALAPRAAIVATLYSALPAIIVAYTVLALRF